MNSGASETRLMCLTILFQSVSDMCPERMCCNGTWASALSSRITISVRDISSEKMALVRLFLMLAARAKSSPTVDFPMAGRAATTIIWPACRPLVSASRSANPVGTPPFRRRGWRSPRSPPALPA